MENKKELEKKIEELEKEIKILKRGEKLFSFNIPCPIYEGKISKKTGKKSKQVVSLNNIHQWLRFHKSKISNEYKNQLKDWYIPENPNPKYESIDIQFELKRHNKRVLDSDNLGIIIKWTIDAIKGEKNDKEGSKWLIDDDKVFYNVVPAILDETLLETEIKVTVYKKEL